MTQPAHAMRDARAWRQLVTPEGVPLDLELASLADRAAAFAIDAVIIVLGLSAVALAAGFCAIGGALASSLGDAAEALLRVLVFALLNGYFIWFELRSSGQTPGKKAVGIRVLSRSGGPLRADAVIARNLVRDVEFFLPLAALMSGAAGMPGGSTLAWILVCVWLLVLALVPAFNRDRLRIGDLVGGTWVVKSPRVWLNRDLAKRSQDKTKGGAPSARRPAHAFTLEQLGIYGVYELQALEDVLRNRNPESNKLREAVAAKIAAKIGYAGLRPADSERFLNDFYAALRAHLERGMLFGRRKEHKNA